MKTKKLLILNPNQNNMKKLSLILIVLLSFVYAKAQNPFAEYGYKPKIATLSQGQYNEFFDNDTLVQIGSVLFNTKSKQIVAFIETDTLYSEATLEPDIVSRWISPDPLAAKFPQVSPYVYVNNNPLIFIDPNGEYAVFHHYAFTLKSMTKLGYASKVSDLVGHYAGTYADNPGTFLASIQGTPYRGGINYNGTANSQHTWSIENSTWHSMAADGENISANAAKVRGQNFGWGKVIQAGNEAKKAGGIENLKENSTGIQALGQGLHALQDAQGHQGVNMANHSISDDITAPRSDIALSVTESALIVTEVISGNGSHLTDGMSLNLSGTNTDQLKTIMGAINSALQKSEKDNIKINFNFND
jgi:hypothetical protein